VTLLKSGEGVEQQFEEARAKGNVVLFMYLYIR
jgi:hypothetical protein